MAILGTLVDRTTVSRAGNAGTTTHRVELTTLAHSLPATNPEAIFVNLRSVEAVAGAQVGTLRPFGLAGNASLATLGYEYGGLSVISVPTVMFDVISVVYHSVIR
jgi:hypothetical protein